MSGAGKSTLGNVLLGEEPFCSNCSFPWCAGTDSCTKETTFAAGHWLGAGPMVTIVDTPGFGDTDGEDEENIDEMMKVLNEVIESAQGIMLVIKGDTTRFGEGLVNMVTQLTMLFGEEVWQHAIIGVSFWHYDQKSIEERNKESHHKSKNLRHKTLL